MQHSSHMIACLLSMTQYTDKSVFQYHVSFAFLEVHQTWMLGCDWCFGIEYKETPANLSRYKGIITFNESVKKLAIASTESI